MGQASTAYSYSFTLADGHSDTPGGMHSLLAMFAKHVHQQSQGNDSTAPQDEERHDSVAQRQAGLESKHLRRLQSDSRHHIVCFLAYAHDGWRTLVKSTAL